MSNISDELVQGMTRSLDETNEGVKKVLEIYGTQQLNMDKVRQHMESVAESSKRMAASVDRLGTLPEDVRRLQASIETNVQAQDRLGAVVDRTNTAIQNLPVNELRQALEQEVKTQVNLVETATGIRNTMKQLQAAISQHAEIEPKLVQAVLEANHRVTEIARVLESFQTTSAMGVKGAYLLPIAEDTLRKLREIESSSDIGEVHRSVALLRKQIQVAKDQALAQAAAVTGGIQ
jgi:methyl-accepting chemotaxis protein